MNKAQSLPEQPNGFSLVEVALAIAIASIALAGTIAAFSSNLIGSNRAFERKAIEETIAQDIGWIRNYAKTWKMQTGPYNLTSTVTTTGEAFEPEPYISFSPNSGGASCSQGLASYFIADAGGTAGASMTPARPFPIPSTSGENEKLTLPTSVKDAFLWRAISYKSGSSSYTVKIRYWLTGSKAQAMGIQRESSIYIEAASWCDS